MRKQLLSYTLALCMMITMLPVSALAADAEPDQEVPVTCTQDETCEAETHLEGCPYDIPTAEGTDSTDFEEDSLIMPLGDDSDESTEPVIPEPDDYEFNKGTINGLKESFFDDLTQEQKQNICLQFPAEINETAVTEIRSNAFNPGHYENANKPKDVTYLLDFSRATNLTEIGTYAFYNCQFRGELKLPASIKTIGESAFRATSHGQSGFTGELYLPASLESLGKVAFSYQDQITSIRFAENSQITDLNNTFNYCQGIEVIRLPSSLRTLTDSAFAYSSLKTAYLNRGVDLIGTKRAFYHCDKLTAVVCEDADEFIRLKSLGFENDDKLGYEVTVSFPTEDADTPAPLERLYNRPLNLVKGENGVWVKDAQFKLPTITEIPGLEGKWSFSQNELKGVSESSIVTGKTLYVVYSYLPPTVTCSTGIDKVYDGTPSIVSVTVEHPLYSPLRSAKNGNVVIAYDWGWRTLGTTYDPPNSGFDKNTYDVGGVRMPTVDTIECLVRIRAFVVRNGAVTNADEFFRETYYFPVRLRKGTPVVTPQYSQDPIPLSGSLPEIHAQSNVPGTITWDADQPLVQGGANYKWTFTPEDNGDKSEGSTNPIKNYNTVTGSAYLYVYDETLMPDAPATGDIVTDLIPELPEGDEQINDSKQQQDILGAKQLAESTADPEAIPEETRDALNEALAKLPQVEVRTDVEVENQAALLENMTGEHAQALMNAPDDADAKYEIVLSAQEKEPTPEESAAIETVRNGVTVTEGKQLTVKESLTIGDNKTERELKTLRRPVTLVFDVPPALAGSSANKRTFYVVRTHTEGDVVSAELLPDQDDDPNTVTVESDQFSYYALAYQDTQTKPNTGGSSHSTGTTRYEITVDAGKHGSVAVTPKTAEKGAAVTITVQPDAGYALDTLLVSDAKNNAVKLKEQGSHKYTFVMPASKVTVEASFEQLAEDEPKPEMPFQDVPADAWYADAVQYAYDNGLMTGTDDTHFQPNTVMTRGMIVAMLWRMEDQPAVSQTAAFSDVAENAYYANAVAWADENGLVKGYANGTFGAADPITREQLAAILYRYAGYRGLDVSNTCDLSEFADAAMCSDYARTALCWVVDRKLISGTGDNTLAPAGHATRAQAAAILMRFERSL